MTPVGTVATTRPPAQNEAASDPRAASLAELEARAHYELECLAYPAEGWVPPIRDHLGRPVADVLIVGAGQGGLALWFALQREGVRHVEIVDRAPPGREGPWITYARMPTLRTPKYLTGPDYGIPSLSVRAWYEAQRFAPSWETLERIPRETWMAYLAWFREFLAVPVRNRTEATSFRGTPDGLVEVTLRNDRGERQAVARRLVLANGMDGTGSWTAPEVLSRSLPRHVWAHSSDAIDFERLRGRRVAVLGAGASAFDNASAALDAGAARVDLCFRRPELPKAEVRAWLEQTGFLAGFGDIDDARKWSVMRRLLGSGAPPPAASVERAATDPRFRMHPGAVWTGTRWTGEAISITSGHGPRSADFVIFATGARFDLSLRPEFSAWSPAIATWGDRFEPPPDQACPELAAYPYLGPGFELVEKRPGEAPWLARVHLFNWGATASLGVTGSSITGMKHGLRRLVSALVRELYRETASQHIGAMPWPEGGSTAPE